MLFLTYKNCQNSSLLGTANSLQLSLPVVSNEASLTGTICNFSRVSTPAVSSSWILPSTASSSFQSFMGSAYLHQHSSTTMLSEVTGQSPMSMSTASYPSVFDWDMTGSTEKSSSLGNLTVTTIDQDRTSNPLSDFGDISIIAPVQSPSDYLALPLSSTQEQKENKNLDETNTELSKALDAYQIPIENQDPPLLPLEIPDIHQLLAGIDPFGQEVQPGSKTVSLQNNSLSTEQQETLESEIESGSSFSDISTLVKDIHLPHLFNSLEDLDQSKDPTIDTIFSTNSDIF
uniref:Uncharacterized protein n=1 Tax=Prolemur simus TaxID=1328070 RepID=A0A8C9DQN1_PROSS